MSDRESEIVGNFMINFAKGIYTSSKRIYLGIGNLKKDKKNYIYLGSFTAIGMGLFLFKENIWAMIPQKFMPLKYGLYLTPGLPLVYLNELGSVKDKEKDKFDELFEKIAFYGKSKIKVKDINGKYVEKKDYPKFIGKDEEGNKVIYSFLTNISIEQWESSRDSLENALDCNIIKIETAKTTKKVVKLHTVPSEKNIPIKIDWEDEYLIDDDFSIVIGENMLGKIVFDLNKNPHVLSAGETGSGKSVVLRLCLWQCALKGAKIYMVDFKGGVEFGKKYESLGEVVTEKDRVIEILTELVEENTARLSLFRELEVKNLAEYNNLAEDKGLKKLCRIAVFIDELAEMMDKSGLSKEEKEKVSIIEQKLSTLARLSRATGENLFIGMQRPDAKVLTGQIKNNVPVRICGRFADRQASEIVLSNTRATKLADIKGRFLYKVGADTIEFQSYYFDDETMFRELERDPKSMGGMLTKEDDIIEDTVKKNIERIIESVEKEENEVIEESNEIEKIEDEYSDEIELHNEEEKIKEDPEIKVQDKDPEYTEPKVIKKSNVTYVFASEAEKRGEKYLEEPTSFNGFDEDSFFDD